MRERKSLPAGPRAGAMHACGRTSQLTERENREKNTEDGGRERVGR